MIDTAAISLKLAPNQNPMKTKIVLFLAVALTGPLLSQPMFADVTYEYTGNPFTNVSGLYTTNDFVTGTFTLASPLPANTPLGEITPISFTFSTSHNGITNLSATIPGPNFTNIISIGTGPTGAINAWNIDLTNDSIFVESQITTANAADFARRFGFSPEDSGNGSNSGSPGTWTLVGSVPDTGSTLSLMTLTLMALGVAARQFKRAAA